MSRGGTALGRGENFAPSKQIIYMTQKISHLPSDYCLRSCRFAMTAFNLPYQLRREDELKRTANPLF
jgi:hypothetical protein